MKDVLLTVYSFGNHIVKVHVGFQAQAFLLHEDVLRATSRFFAAALNPVWKEGLAHELHMAEEDPKIFKVYADWVYTKKVNLNLPTSLVELEEVYELLVALYVFAERIQDDSFADNVLDVLAAASKIRINGESVYLDSDQISVIYQQTPPSSPLRKFVLHEYVWFGNSERFDDLARLLIPCDFLFDVAVALFNSRQIPKGKAPVREVDSCAYHKHVYGGECYKNRGMHAESVPL